MAKSQRDRTRATETLMGAPPPEVTEFRSEDSGETAFVAVSVRLRCGCRRRRTVQGVGKTVPIVRAGRAEDYEALRRPRLVRVGWGGRGAAESWRRDRGMLERD